VKTKTKILIVEDDLPLAMMMAFLLTRAGCDVLTANTGEKGMEMALEKKFDLITLDVDLPDINGFELCHELKQRHFSRQTPVVFVSGRPGEQDVQRGLETGAVDYLTKPFDPQEFTSRLLSHVRVADEMAGPTLNFRGAV
jgi:two-component system alkaline phosphatase synthesis response regulator PhoP